MGRLDVVYGRVDGRGSVGSGAWGEGGERGERGDVGYFTLC